MKFFVGFLFLIGLSLGSFVEAHQIKTDQGITVLLHVDPSDEPYSGTTTRMYLAFSSKSVDFEVEDCECTVYVAPYDKLHVIKTEGAIMDVASMERVYGSQSFSYTFPRHDIYAVVLEGTPKENATFESFRIVYDLRVARGEELVAEIEETIIKTVLDYPYVHIGSGVLLILAAFLGISTFLKHRRKL